MRKRRYISLVLVVLANLWGTEVSGQLPCKAGFSFSIPKQVYCIGETITFTANTTDSLFIYNWIVPGATVVGGSTTGPMVQIQYFGSANHMVELYVTIDSPYCIA